MVSVPQSSCDLLSLCHPEAAGSSSPKDLGAPRDAPKAHEYTFGAFPY